MARAQRSPAASEVDFADYDEARAWCGRQKPEVYIGLAVRAALRVLPLIWNARNVGAFPARIILPTFRAAFVASAAVTYPGQRNRLRTDVAAALADAVAVRIDTATASADGARAAALATARAAVLATARATAAANAATLAVFAAPVDAVGSRASASVAATDAVVVAAAAAVSAAAAQADAIAIEQGTPLAEIVSAPLWPNGIPGTVFEPWEELRIALLSNEAQHWRPWAQWYEHVRDRGGSFGEGFDLAVASLTDAQWDEEPRPAAVNKRIADLLAKHTQPGPTAEAPGIPAWHALDQKSLQHWLGTQPREVALAIAGRAALRALPLVVAGPIQLGFGILPFFRAAFAIWTSFQGPNRPMNRAAWLPLRTLSENNEAGAAVNLAAAAALPNARNNVAEFAARSISAAGRAEPLIAEDTLQEIVEVDGAGDFDARGRAALALATKPLWRNQMVPRVTDVWAALRNRMLADGDDWDVWVNWYEDRLAGRPSLGEDFDRAVNALPSELWESAPKAVNAFVKELIAAHSPGERIPAQGVGPHFALGASDKIALALPVELDPDGNNIGRIRQLLPLLREAAEDLAARLNPNAFSELARNLAAYRVAIEGEPETIIWGLVFARGVRLDNAAAAARRQIEDRLQPPLEDATQEALDSVLTLHGPMMLSTVEGRELMELANQMLLTREQQAAEREHAVSVATALHEDKEVIEPPAAEIVLAAVETMGQGPHPERGSAIGGATIKNVMIWTVGVGALAAVAGVGLVQTGTALVAIEGLKKSKRFSALTDALGARIDGVLRTGEAFQNFVIRNERQLRQMADNSPGMRWMLPYIDVIVKRNAAKK